MAESEWIREGLTGASSVMAVDETIYIYISNGVYLKQQYPVPEVCCFSASKRHSVPSDLMVSPHGPNCSRDLVFRQHVPTHRITLHSRYQHQETA